MISSSSSSSSSGATVSSFGAESAQRVGTVCRSSRAVSTLLQLLQSVNSISGSGRSRDGSCRNGAGEVSTTAAARLSVTLLPVAAWPQCACRRKSLPEGTCLKVLCRSPSLSSSLMWSFSSRSADDCRSCTCQQYVDHEFIEKQEHQWRKIRRRVGITQINPSNCFRRVEKLLLPSVFDTSLSSSIHDVKLAELSDNSFEWKNVTF